ncbi:MAG: hypothetical protein R2836_05785 [Chitinophagales bacterium]
MPRFRAPSAYTNTGGNWFNVADNSQNYLLLDVTQSIGAVLGEALGAGATVGQGLMTALTTWV